VSGSVAQRQHANVQAAQPPPQPAAPPAPEPPTTAETTIAELERLAELKQRGLLTEGEFTALKARLIAG
jgi:hypothetical protein